MRLLETRYCTIDLDPASSVARYTRSSLPYASNQDIETEAARVEDALHGLPHDRRLLVDLRAAIPRNDPGFEVAIVKLRTRLFTNTARAAVLVRTAVGVLQTRRHVRDDGVNGEVFEDEALALAYLATPIGRPITTPPASASRSVRPEDPARVKSTPPPAAKSTPPPAVRKQRPG